MHRTAERTGRCARTRVGDCCCAPRLWSAGIVPIILMYGLTRMGYAVCNELREFVLAPVTHSVMQKTGTRVFGHLLQMDHRDKYTREPGGTAMSMSAGLCDARPHVPLFCASVPPTRPGTRLGRAATRHQLLGTKGAPRVPHLGSC